MSFGYALIALAIDVLVASLIGESGYFVPILLILLGAYGLVIAAFLWTDRSERRHSSPNGTYVFFWSALLTLAGTMILVNDAYSGNLTLLGVVLAIWIGVSVAVISGRGTRVQRD